MASGLPPGWEVHYSGSTGKPYYFHTASGKSQYEPPAFDNAAPVPTTSAGPALPPGWVLQTSARTGKSYFFNTLTGESRYDPPAGAAAPAHVAPVSYGTAATSSEEPAAKRARFEGGAGGSSGGSGASSTAAASSLAYSFPLPAASAVAPARDMAVAAKVADAYDHLKDVGREGRMASNILHLKNFNNWVKASLIAAYAPPACKRVLDLACGKLGDLQKWKAAGVRQYCGIDISRQAVEDASVRFNSVCSGTGIVAKLARADLGVTDLAAAGVLTPDEKFDAISIQFALHYLFQTEQRALTFFRNIAGRLAPGGVFLGTIPDAAVLVRRLRDLAPEETGWGNSIYSVDFTPESKRAQYGLGSCPYGVKYDFFLVESVEHVAEYLVPWQLLERLAAAAGLRPLAKDNFHAFFERMMKSDPEAAERLARMNVLDVDGTLRPEEWEAAGVYRVFAFQAPLDPAEVPPPPPAPLPPMAALVPHQAATVQHGFGYKASLTKADIADVLG